MSKEENLSINYCNNTGAIYKYSAYRFIGGVLYWMYDSYYENDPNNRLIDRSLEELSSDGVVPTLLVIEREDDIIAYHYSHGKWRLNQLD